jgi:hypothetical protein
MNTIELLKSPSDRRRYTLGDLGSLRLNGLFMRSATAETDGNSFTVERTRWTTASVVARGPLAEIGAFHARTLRGGGRLTWLEEEYALRHEQPLGETYALVHNDRPLALATARGWWGWGVKRPLTMQVSDVSDASLLLFLAFVVRTLANQRSSDAAATTVATTPTYSG